MKEIPLTQGYVAIVDDHWYDKLVAYGSWYYDTGYAMGRTATSHVAMHHFIKPICFEDGEEVDHINNNKLDNREENLRICTRSQNHQNTKKPSNNTSGYKGVSRNYNKWMARIKLPDRRIHLGRFMTKEEAAIAYDKAAIKHFGEFANTNFPKSNYVL